MNVPYAKYHGTGNDFLLIDAAECVPDRGALATRECDRSDGVGADGILFLALEPAFTPPRVVMTLVQPDGGTAPMCGNGARCAAAWAMERTGSDDVMIDTQAGTRYAYRTEDGVAVEMGAPTFDPERVPVEADEPFLEREVEGLEVTALNTGVPHAVAVVDDVDDVDLETVAPPVRHADIFPRGTNVTLASPDGDGFRQRTFERGVEGETRACGTGAVAIAEVARRFGLCEPDAPAVDVRPPGGPLRVTFDDRSRAVLIGAAEREFEDTVRIPSPMVDS